jgi:hypothetical protein
MIELDVLVVLSIVDILTVMFLLPAIYKCNDNNSFLCMHLQYKLLCYGLHINRHRHILAFSEYINCLFRKTMLPNE